MLYVCSVPSHIDWNDFLNSQIIPVYIIDKLRGNRDKLSSRAWSTYESVFNYVNFWILTPEELRTCKITDIKWHKGESA